jgi:ribosomal protein S18 acetylase RimI-like enzyme
MSERTSGTGGAPAGARGTPTSVGSRPDVRRVTAQDIPVLAAMLARAFWDDPVASWAWRPDHLRPKALERFQATRLRQLIGGEELWTTDDLTSAALWAPPGAGHSTLRETAMMVPCFVHPRLALRGPLVGYGWDRLERAHPHDPQHYYLAILGTEPDAQGQGLGSAVLRPVLDRCDEDQVCAYLESSKERNVAFYARHGFRVLSEIRFPRGPIMWRMWRDPRS